MVMSEIGKHFSFPAKTVLVKAKKVTAPWPWVGKNSFSTHIYKLSVIRYMRL